MSKLADLCRDPAAGLDQIAAYLDGLGLEERAAELDSLGRGAQARLYDKAKDSAPLSLDDLVPPAKAPSEQVVYRGKNTLPLPPPWKRFEKRLFRPAQGGKLYGYNASPLHPFVGPGYFAVLPTAGNAEWATRAGLVVEYEEIPGGAVPEGWPKVVTNRRRLARLVFVGSRDFLRRVSSGVAIGAAYKGDKRLGQYFTLCRLG